MVARPLNPVLFSVDTHRAEFHDDAHAALLLAGLLNDILLNGVCTSGTGGEWSDHVLLHVTMLALVMDASELVNVEVTELV